MVCPMVQLEVWSFSPNDWHARLRDPITNRPMGEEYIADQRGAVIGQAFNWLPLTHVLVTDVAPPNY